MDSGCFCLFLCLSHAIQQIWDNFLPEECQIRLRGAAGPLPDNTVGSVRGVRQHLEGDEVRPDILVNLQINMWFIEVRKAITIKRAKRKFEIQQQSWSRFNLYLVQVWPRSTISGSLENYTLTTFKLCEILHEKYKVKLYALNKTIRSKVFCVQ